LNTISDQTADGKYTIDVASHIVVPATSILISPNSPPAQAVVSSIKLTNPLNSVINTVGAAVVGAAVVGAFVGAAVVGAAVVGALVGEGVGQSAHALVVVTVLAFEGWNTCLT